MIYLNFFTKNCEYSNIRNKLIYLNFFTKIDGNRNIKRLTKFKKNVNQMYTACLFFNSKEIDVSVQLINIFELVFYLLMADAEQRIMPWTQFFVSDFRTQQYDV